VTSKERWLPVAGWEMTHLVSDEGRVKRPGRWVNNNGGRSWLPDLILIGTPVNKKTAHLQVRLTDNGRQKMVLVHRIMLEAHVGPCPPGVESIHRNDVADDNRLENLRWGTHTENAQDMIRNGHLVFTEGEDQWCAKLTRDDVLAIRAASENHDKQRDIAARFNVSQTTVWRIVNRKSWRHVAPIMKDS